MNPLYGMMGQQNGQMNALMQRFQQFKQSFTGDPRQQIQKMLNSGQITQQQYDRAVQMANQLRQMLGR